MIRKGKRVVSEKVSSDDANTNANPIDTAKQEKIIQNLRDGITTSVKRWRMVLVLCSAFASVSLFLAGTGVYDAAALHQAIDLMVIRNRPELFATFHFYVFSSAISHGILGVCLWTTLKQNKPTAQTTVVATLLPTLVSVTWSSASNAWPLVDCILVVVFIVTERDKQNLMLELRNLEKLKYNFKEL